MAESVRSTCIPSPHINRWVLPLIEYHDEAYEAVCIAQLWEAGWGIGLTVTDFTLQTRIFELIREVLATFQF